MLLNAERGRPICLLFGKTQAPVRRLSIHITRVSWMMTAGDATPHRHRYRGESFAMDLRYHGRTRTGTTDLRLLHPMEKPSSPITNASIGTICPNQLPPEYKEGVLVGPISFIQIRLWLVWHLLYA